MAGRFFRNRKLRALSAAALAALAFGATQRRGRAFVRQRARSIPVLRRLRAWTRELRDPPWSAADVGNGRAATDIVLLDPMGIARNSSGTVYITDRGRGTRGRFVWRVEPDGTAHVIAGTGRRGGSPAGVPALESSLGSPEGVAVDEGGLVYVVDSANHVVLRIEHDGGMTRIAGTGERGFGGDGGPATDASLAMPYDLRFDSRGNLYIADFGNHRIRRVTPDGMIETAAGTGEAGYSGDGAPATAARLNGPYGAFVDAADRLLIADSFNHVIRRVDEDGVITTIAGAGAAGYAGDGGPALQALFDTPQSLAVDGDGRIYVGDEHNHAIRVVGTDGVISAFIGNGLPGFAAEGVTANQAQLNDPENLLLLGDGSMLITDGDNGRVLRVKPDGAVQPFAGGAA